MAVYTSHTIVAWVQSCVTSELVTSQQNRKQLRKQKQRGGTRYRLLLESLINAVQNFLLRRLD
jgi:hypothetical protein